MKKRIIVSVIMGIILIPFLFFTDTWALPALVAFFAARGVFEMYRCLGIHKLWAVSVPAYVLSAMSPFCARYFGCAEFFRYAVPLSILICVWMFAVFTFSNDKITIEQTGISIAMLFYITGGFSFLVLICDVENYGIMMLFPVFIASWVTDTFAYFTGRVFGKHKLIPKVSPNKTIEGSIGGIIFCTAAFLIYGFFINAFSSISANYFMMAFAGLCASVVSQVGDLIMSAVKRTRNVKDYGKLIPGHGGLLDRFDSVLAVSVIMFTLESFIGVFNS